MIAPAPKAAAWPPPVKALACALALLAATPAPAAIGASLSLTNDQMFRGRSLSAGRPVGRAELSYDSASGLYAGVSISGVATRAEGVQLFDGQEYAGYARRLSPRLTLDLGVTNVNYSDYISSGRSAGYTEIYAGLITPHLGGHLRISPDYFRGSATLYGEADGMIGRAQGWQIVLHGGLLRWLDQARKPIGAPTTHYDWSAGVARRFGPVGARLLWAGGGPNQDFYDGRAQGRSALVAALDFAF
jgi:uncharacterized protein (TIGR02001 family)